MIKLSIIIPVYNIEKYILKCLKSISDQTFKDFEIICVNDGSTDGSLSVLQDFIDERIIIIDKVNEGSGVARNTALAKARGKYVYFVDGDDWLKQNALQKMISKADELNTDILIFGGLSYFGNTGKKGYYSADKLLKKYFDRVFSSKDIKKDVFKFPSTAWTKLYKRDFLIKNNIKFQNIKVGQDQLLFFHSMITAQRIALLPENLYCYRRNRDGSKMSVKQKNDFSPVYVFYGIEKMLKETGFLEDYKDIFVNNYFLKATSWLGKFQDDMKHEYYEEYAKLLEHIKSEYPSGWWMKFNPKEKDGYWVLKFKQTVAKSIFLILLFSRDN